MERLAIIDLGTNTFNLLIVERHEKAFKEIYIDRVGVGLGLGGINEKRIAPEAFQRGLKTIKHFKSICAEHGVENIKPFGTSAVRNAENKEAFIAAVKEQAGLEIKVVSGEEEAGFIYQGVSGGAEIEEPYLIMDIGGGSTEFIFAKQEGIIKARSFEIGAARIFQKFDFADPLSNEDVVAIESYLEKNTQPFFDEIQTDVLVGASGSFETFYELITRVEYPKNKYVKPNIAHFEFFLNRIIQSTMAEREQEDRIIPIRKKMAPIAAVKIRWIIRKLDITKVMISPNALKEGVLWDM